MTIAKEVPRLVSFTSDIRQELARVPVERHCDAIAELCGAAMAAGAVSFRGPGRYGLSIQTESREILERLMALMQKHLRAQGSVRVLHTDRLGGQTFYALSPEPASAPAMLDALHLLDPSQPFGIRTSPAPEMVEKDCCRRAFLRGAFLLCGSASSPDRGYHLDFAPATEALAEAVRGLLMGYYIPARLSRRKAQPIAYVKDGEAVSDALALLGAGVAVMALENVRILRGVRNDVNRQANCDSNNIDKVVAASEKQISLIRAIERRLGFSGMPKSLREIAELRMQYPDASLTELGNMMTPPLGKSGVNARMRRIEALAEELVNE